MAIKFEQNADEQSAEKWRMTHWLERREKYSAELKALDVELHQLVETKRQQLEDFLYDRDFNELLVFINGRQKNETVEAYSLRHASPEIKELLKRDEDFRERYKFTKFERDRLGNFRGMCAHQAQFVKRFTDHPKQVNSEKPRAFTVNVLTDVLRKDVKERVESIVRNFIYKVQQKILDLIVANGEYTAKLKSHTFVSGVIEAKMVVKFKDGEFLASLSAKSNRSVLGNWFMQYPLTFHRVTSPDSKLDDKAMASEKEMLKHFRAEAWEPPPMPKERFFSNLKIGDIVLMDDDTHALAVKSRKDEVTVWHPKTGERKCKIKGMQKIVARTSGSYNRKYHDENPGPHWCWVDGLLGNQKLEVPRSMVPDGDLSFAAETEVVRKAGFQLWLEKNESPL